MRYKLDLARRPNLVIVNKKEKKKRKKPVDIAVLADYKVKVMESEKKDTNRDLARELKKTTTPEHDGVIGSLVTITKGLVKGLEDLEINEHAETIQTIGLVWFGFFV